jgi:P27 family predicted phage terminase small subunit
LKLIKGNPGKRAVNKEEPKLAIPTESDPPACLEGEAREVWIELYDELVAKGVLTVGDVKHFEEYCTTLQDLRKYQKLAKDSGPDAAIIRGYQKQISTLRGQLRQYAADLGLTPASRSGIKTSAKEKESKLARFLQPS